MGPQESAKLNQKHYRLSHAITYITGRAAAAGVSKLLTVEALEGERKEAKLNMTNWISSVIALMKQPEWIAAQAVPAVAELAIVVEEGAAALV